MQWPEEATPLWRGEEHAASLLNKTSQLLTPPRPLTPSSRRPGKLTTCQGCRRDQTNSAHVGAGGDDSSCGSCFLGGGSSAFCLVSVCIDLIGLIISAGTDRAQLRAFYLPRGRGCPTDKDLFVPGWGVPALPPPPPPQPPLGLSEHPPSVGPTPTSGEMSEGVRTHAGNPRPTKD